ncbi:acyl-CoA dehydrogenase family protein [Streptomyces pseudovenezuelae]|uniref:Alkylation response protein AidB-like acyl-CoA dehydrogenase n=1 Tax=Streptomyces pseudovenezuelae TaxID=67350 RepID=A0ABT6M1C1_9ACTN|nr:acyl-CoA dehydrogenase family protein [Streptomyces pseudovenezuelae]MDH6222348.1 alkylation response protein AidB-like acyl-CoA dehydrogenase [Streptomyces pseudovenezuelae]
MSSNNVPRPTDHAPRLTDDVLLLAADQAQLADQQRQLNGEVVTALTSAGLARHFVPRQWGGKEGSFLALLEDIAVVGEACTSAAWVAMLWAAHGRFAASLPEEGQRELWGGSPDVRIAAALVPPAGRAEPVDGGWRVTGSWACVSGVEQAAWVLVAAPEAYGDGVRVCAVPGDAVDVEDTWDATGLRGTGSHTAVVRDVFVPRRRTFPLAELMRGSDAQEAARCHRVPAHLPGGLMFCAPALGAARRAVAVWSEWAAAKGPGGRPNHDSAAVRETLAVASAQVDAAGLLLERAARRADTEPVTEALVAGNRRDAAVAARMLAEAVDRLFRTGGAHIRAGAGELTRLWRDVHTVASHGVLRLEPVAGAYASAVLGAEAVDAVVATEARTSAASRSR